MNRPTLPVLYGETDDNNVDKKKSRAWYSEILSIMCGRTQKKWCAKNRMQVAELTPQLINNTQ